MLKYLFKTPKKLGPKEFVALMAMISAISALSTDAVLPALITIGEKLQISNPNQAQLIIGIFFFGLAIGSPFFGPMSDSIGRKKSISLGLAIFLIGCLISLISENITTLLFSRFLQGFGASSARIIANAIIRDTVSGRKMARINSLVTSIFITVPIIAPFFGQIILNFFNWRAIFVGLILITFLLFPWFLIRQRETLETKNKIPFKFKEMKNGMKACLKEPFTIAYSIAGGFVFSILLIYLSTSPQIFMGIYGVGDYFPYYFSSVAISMGISSLLNSYLVMRFGMIYLSNLALIFLTSISLVLFLYLTFFNSPAPIWLFIAYLMFVFFCLGLVFGNFLALAMLRVGHVAGIASSLITSTLFTISFMISLLVGQLFDSSVNLVVFAFFIAALSAKIIILLLTKNLKVEII